MDNNFIIVIFGFTLLLILSLIIAITIYLIPSKKKDGGTIWFGGCAGTRWGCCPDGVTTRLDQDGTNCTDVIGGCAGTRWGCCPDGTTPNANKRGSNCQTDYGCSSMLFGCCKDGLTARENKESTNCPNY